MTRPDEIARHNAPELYKPLIDAELARLIEVSGADAAAARRCLEELDAESLDAWHYLQAALRSLRPLIWNASLRERLRDHWGSALFEPGSEVPYNCVESRDELDPDGENPGEHPVIVDEYPVEAHEALRQEHFWAARGRTVYGVEVDGGIARVYVASPERFEILGQDAVELVQRLVRDAC